MDILRITVIGKDLFDVMKEKLQLAGINTVNQVNSGMLGNLTTLTYYVELEEKDVIEKRKRLMKEIEKDNMRLMALYVQGDWMRIFVMKPLKT